MKKLFFSILLMVVMAIGVNLAQGGENQKPIKLKPVFKFEEVVFAFNALNAVEITGVEVDKFIECRNTLGEPIKLAQQAGKKASDDVSIEMDINIAQSILNLLNRAKIAGGQADIYQRFVAAVKESAKNVK